MTMRTAAPVVALILVVLLIAVPRPRRDLLLFNHTPSVPIGFYLRTDAALSEGAYVTVRAADVAPALAHARGFEDPRDRFIKRVAATRGDHVCVVGTEVLVNRVSAARRLTHDRRGSPLLAWEGCRILGDNEVLLLGDTPDSFDGRYWGPVHTSQVEGVWRRIGE